MHSSRMRTARLLMYRVSGGSVSRGVCLGGLHRGGGGVCIGVVYIWSVCLGGGLHPGGVCLGGLPRGVYLGGLPRVVYLEGLHRGSA